MQRIATNCIDFQRFANNCIDFIRIAKNLQEMQRICNVHFLLTSGVKAHLGGLEGKRAEATNIYIYILPLYVR